MIIVTFRTKPSQKRERKEKEKERVSSRSLIVQPISFARLTIWSHETGGDVENKVLGHSSPVVVVAELVVHGGRADPSEGSAGEEEEEREEKKRSEEEGGFEHSCSGY